MPSPNKKPYLKTSAVGVELLSLSRMYRAVALNKWHNFENTCPKAKQTLLIHKNPLKKAKSQSCKYSLILHMVHLLMSKTSSSLILSVPADMLPL